MVKVAYCGYNLTETEAFAVKRDNGSGDYLLVLFITPFYIFPQNGDTIVTEPMACVLFSPNAPHYYQSVKKFTNSFIHFTVDSYFISELGIPTDTIMYPKRPEAINEALKRIVTEAVNETTHYERKIDSLVNVLLVDLARDIHDIRHSILDVSMYLQYKKMRQHIIDHCEKDWTTDSICSLAHTEKSQVYSYYQSFFKTTPKADIIFARIERAKTLLARPEMNVNEAAEQCGFKTISHFTRAFRKYVNCTPSEFAQRAKSESDILVLYDMQECLKETGSLTGCFLSPGGKTKLTVAEIGGTKTVFVSERQSMDSGLVIELSAIEKLWPGDRITITGRIAGTAPEEHWAMAMQRYGKNFDNLAQHYVPSGDDLYRITYLLDTSDLETPVQIRSTQWGKDDKPMDFFVDDIQITRDRTVAPIEIDNRGVVYSLAQDENINRNNPSDAFIRPSGAPIFTVTDGKKTIRVERRLNNWDGIDVCLPVMKLKPGNLYTIQAAGRIEGPAPPGAAMMYQILPGYIWRSISAVGDNSDFSLTHTFSVMELKTAEAVRITSNPEGTGMSFAISEIEVKSRRLPH